VRTKLLLNTQRHRFVTPFRLTAVRQNVDQKAHKRAQF